MTTSFRSPRSPLCTLLFLALLASVALAWAGGATVLLDGAPPTPTAGQAFTVAFTVRSLHTGEPVADGAPTIHAVHTVSGQTIAVEAVPAGPTGRYAATLTLPFAGVWHWEIRPYGGHESGAFATAMLPLQVWTGGVHAKGAY